MPAAEPASTGRSAPPDAGLARASTLPDNVGSQASTAQARSPREIFTAITASLHSVVFTDPSTIRTVVACAAAGGHLLVEDLPGLGKTTLAKALARSLGLGFRRVQCTADLLPADITGAIVVDPTTREFSFRRGPVFTNVLMADELNRASPRTQSALLEAMEEYQVTVDGDTHLLPRPFLVIATQNPFDAAGTSPLPHGQRDRFLVRLSLGYPGREAEDRLLAGVDPSSKVASLSVSVTHQELAVLFHAVTDVYVSDLLRGYVLDLVGATRIHPAVAVGASPRAAMALLRVGRSLATADGRSSVLPEDIQVAAEPVLAHRLVQRGGRSEGAEADIMRDILQSVRVPTASTLLPPGQ